MCLVYLHIPLYEFYDYTPKEIDIALSIYFEQEQVKNQNEWERTRLQIYYNYLLTPSRKRKVTYSSFKNELLPFTFDKKVERDVMSDDTFKEIISLF